MDPPRRVEGDQYVYVPGCSPSIRGFTRFENSLSRRLERPFPNPGQLGVQGRVQTSLTFTPMVIVTSAVRRRIRRGEAENSAKSMRGMLVGCCE